MSDISVGELMVGRKLRTHSVNGKRQYLPGQDKGRRISKTDGIVSYVDREGALCIMPCEYIEDEWMPREVMFRIGLGHAEVRKVPAGSRLSDPAQRAMELAGKQQPRSPAGQTT